MKYLVNYCLDNESDFEDFHIKFDKRKNELFLTLDEVLKLIERCVSEDDTIGIGLPTEKEGNWDYLFIHGVDRQHYTLEYQIARFGGAYFRYNVAKKELLELFNKKNILVSNFEDSGFKFVSY
jgi:hypothetical protein